MSVEIPINLECRRHYCHSTDLTLIFEPVREVGSEDSETHVFDGVRCDVCNVRLLDDDLREIASYIDY